MTAQILASHPPHVNRRKPRIQRALDLISYFHRVTGHSDSVRFASHKLAADLDAALHLLAAHPLEEVHAVIGVVAAGAFPKFRVTRVVHLAWKWHWLLCALRRQAGEIYQRVRDGGSAGQEEKGNE